MLKSTRTNINRACNRSTRRRGTAFLEFALVLPLLGLLMLGVIQYGLIASTTAVLTNLSREGARYAALSNTTTDAAIIDHVKNAAAATRVNPDHLTIEITPVESTREQPAAIGGNVTVSIKYDLNHQRFMPGTQFLINAFNNGGPGLYKTQTTMRIQP